MVPQQADGLLDAAAEPIDHGVETNCGFLALSQRGLAAQAILHAGRVLVAQRPDIDAVVQGCINVSAPCRAPRDLLPLPVFDIHSRMTWLHAGPRPCDFRPPASLAAPLSKSWR